MKIEIHNAELADPVMLAACLERVKRYYGPGHHRVVVQIWADPADVVGMLGYDMFLPDKEGGQIVIGAIRRPGSTEIEFHS